MKKVLSVLALVGGVLGFYACEKDECGEYSATFFKRPFASLVFNNGEGAYLEKEQLDTLVFYSEYDTLQAELTLATVKKDSIFQVDAIHIYPLFMSGEREYYFSLVQGDIDTLRISTEETVKKCYSYSEITSLGFNGEALEQMGDNNVITK